MTASEIYRQAAVQVFGNATGPSDAIVNEMDRIERHRRVRDELIVRESQEKSRHEAAQLAIANDWLRLQESCRHASVANDMTCTVCRKELP